MALSYPRQVPKGTAGLGQVGTPEAAEVEKMISMTDKEMQGEVQEVEAAVDACYRTWARRAGLGDVLPTGRPMTEKELDDLSERLGDGLGARARRREEVERMSLAEMEAELRGVREEIGRRRSMGGRLAASDANAHMPLGPGGGRVQRLRLLQPEQHCGLVFATGVRRMRQHGQGG
jgi:hypothetical protein